MSDKIEEMHFKEKCVNCGQLLKLGEWGPTHTCPYCGKNTVNVDIKEVHVLFSDMHENGLRHFLSNEYLKDVLGRTEKKHYVGVDYHLLILNYGLWIGDISNPPYSNANYYAHNYSSAENAERFIKNQFEKISEIPNNTSVYFWVSDNDDQNALLNMLYFADKFKRFENIFLVRWKHTEKSFDGIKFSMVDALKNKEKLSKQDLYDMSNRFKEIQGWQSECIVGNSQRVEPWEISKLEDYVLGCINNKYQNSLCIYSKVYKKAKKDIFLQINFDMVLEMIHLLLLTGKIKGKGSCGWWGNCLMLCEQQFRLAKQQSETYSFDRVVEFVYNAFEGGYTYFLYNVLDDESVLICENLKLIGKWKIIEYIENVGAKRVHCEKEKVNCDILKKESDTAEIQLCYEKEEHKEYWTIKISYDGSVIRNMGLTKQLTD